METGHMALQGGPWKCTPRSPAGSLLGPEPCKARAEVEVRFLPPNSQTLETVTPHPLCSVLLIHSRERTPSTPFPGIC